MTTNAARALVVDDEVKVRNLTIRMLNTEGFACDGAGDGLEAGHMLAENTYDVVVTDLRMPNRHGHALALDVLAMPHRPAIVVLTGVLEPALARDLIARGVDCVEFKPIDYGMFVAKVKALVLRRSASRPRRRFTRPTKSSRQTTPAALTAATPATSS